MIADLQMDKLAKLIEQCEFDAAWGQLEACRPGRESNSEWWLLKGMLEARAGDVDDAYSALQQSIELDPDNTEAVFQLAYTSDLHGEDETAIELYEECISQPPMHVNALINLAVIYEDRGQYDKAESCLQQVLEDFPNHPRAAMYLKDIDSSKSMYYDEDHERQLEKRNAVLDIPISDFELSVRSRNCLKKMNITTLGDLLRATETELLSYKNFGETSLNEIKAMLRQKGLRLGQALEEDASTIRPGGSVEGEQTDADLAILGKPVSELELSVRARKCLQRLGITTLGELANRSEAELLASKNFGQTSLAEIKLRLVENGLSLRKMESRRRA